MSHQPTEDLGLFLQRAVLPAGWRAIHERVVGSTMDLAREAARSGPADRTIFVCDYQTAGRGRRGRSWQAPPGLGLLFTLLLRSSRPSMLETMLVSVAVAEAIERLPGLESRIKWPNDLMVGDRKLAGILAETYSGPSGGYALVGCGINVNQDAATLAAIGRPATSLREEVRRTVHRGELLVTCLEQVDAWLALDPTTRDVSLRRAWEQRLWGRGHLLRFRDRDQEFAGTIEGVSPAGALIVRRQDGGAERIVAGEILL